MRLGHDCQQWSSKVALTPGVDTGLGNGELGVGKNVNGEFGILKLRIWELKIPVNCEIGVFRIVNCE